MAYNTKILNRIFAALSIALLFVVIWLFLEDYLRPWKAIQMEAQRIERQEIEAKLQKTQKELDQKKLEALKENIARTLDLVAKRQGRILAIKAQLKETALKIQNQTIIDGTLNSQVSALSYQYSLAYAKHLPQQQDLHQKLTRAKALFAESKNNIKVFRAQKKSLEKKLQTLKKEHLKATKEMKAFMKKKTLLEKAMAKTAFDPLFLARNSPLIDYLDPTLKIQQIVLPHITDDRYFQQVPKVDRCITCHTFIAQEGHEDRKNPHKTHPQLDLYLGPRSPHPLKSIGCTVCHGGEGHRVHDFNSAAHTPSGPEQKAAWVKAYNYHPPHKIPQPMLKTKYTEAACLKCHRGDEFIPKAAKYNEGKRLMKKYGCHGCHKIEGLEHWPKPGPSLKKIASKVTKEFFKNWVWDPKSFHPQAKMPHFFSQSNNSTKDFALNTITEVNAMAEAVWARSSPYTPPSPYGGGNPAQGKELIRTLGCLGCHGVEGLETESQKVKAFAGPFLGATGSKVTGAWLVSWLKNPRHFQEDTIMPSFRLTDSEANAIASYLLSLKNPFFEKLRFEPLDKKRRDHLLLTSFSAFVPKEQALQKLADMKDAQRTLELGRRSLTKYGCHSCHAISGLEHLPPIGPELTTEGSKPLTQFDFGHEHTLEHSRDGWLKAHLLNPRRWDKGHQRPFKDLARMPHFYMTEKEAESITLALLAQVNDFVPLAGQKRKSAHEKLVSRGMKLISRYNCIGCHSIDGDFGDIGAIFEDDPNLGPPALNGEGHRVQADWLYHFFSRVTSIRPYLKVRMPSFPLTSGEKNHLVSFFQHKAKVDAFSDDMVLSWQPGELRAAKHLFRVLDCASCHTTGFNRDPPLAPSLFLTKGRLRPQWVKQWLLNPQEILEYTTMPSFWEKGESQEASILKGDPNRQIEALTKYLYSLDRKAP